MFRLFFSEKGHRSQHCSHVLCAGHNEGETKVESRENAKTEDKARIITQTGVYETAPTTKTSFESDFRAAAGVDFGCPKRKFSKSLDKYIYPVLSFEHNTERIYESPQKGETPT